MDVDTEPVLSQEVSDSESSSSYVTEGEETVTEYDGSTSDSDESTSEPDNKKGSATKKPAKKTKSPKRKKPKKSANTAEASNQPTAQDFNILLTEYNNLKNSFNILLNQHNELAASVSKKTNTTTSNSSTSSKTSQRRPSNDVNTTPGSSRTSPLKPNSEVNTTPSSNRNNCTSSLDVNKPTSSSKIISTSSLKSSSTDNSMDPTTAKGKQVQVINQNNKNVNTNQQKLRNKIIKPPPLIIYNINIKSYITKVKTSLGHDNFSFKKLNKNMYQLYLSNINEFNTIKSTLQGNEERFYTFTPKEEKPHSFIIKNLDYNFDENEIETAYKNIIAAHNHNITITKISKFHTKKQLKENKQGFWLIQLTPSSDVSTFISIKQILNSIIRVEKISKNDIPQCRNCQRLGHSATNCNMKFRCVKCTQPHKKGECPLPSKEERDKNPTLQNMQPSCVNCGGEGHPANYKNCPKYKEVAKRFSEKRKEQAKTQQFKSQSYSNFTTQGMSYATVASQNIPKATPKQTPPQKTSSPLFGVDILDYTQKLSLLIPTINKMQDPTQQKISLLAFITEYVITN